MGDRMDVPLPDSNYELDIVLVGINHPGNLGAVCRTMLNHGFDKLSLVNPNCSPDDEEARNRAEAFWKNLDDPTSMILWRCCIRIISCNRYKRKA